LLSRKWWVAPSITRSLVGWATGMVARPNPASPDRPQIKAPGANFSARGFGHPTTDYRILRSKSKWICAAMRFLTIVAATSEITSLRRAMRQHLPGSPPHRNALRHARSADVYVRRDPKLNANGLSSSRLACRCGAAG
jgi:hypothetical protein